MTSVRLLFFNVYSFLTQGRAALRLACPIQATYTLHRAGLLVLLTDAELIKKRTQPSCEQNLITVHECS